MKMNKKFKIVDGVVMDEYYQKWYKNAPNKSTLKNQLVMKILSSDTDNLLFYVNMCCTKFKSFTLTNREKRRLLFIMDNECLHINFITLKQARKEVGEKPCFGVYNLEEFEKLIGMLQ